MGRTKRKTGIILAGIILILILVSLGQTDTLRAMFDEEEAVHIKPDEIEDSTLIIGTHLVHISAFNDTIYKIAADSAGFFGQTELYYKSELGDGKWYSLSNAKSLADIREKRKQISDSVIKELWFTHHTKSDGKTYDLKTEKQVLVYDIISPYDLHKLPELKPLELMNQAGKATGDFFETEVRDDETDELDRQITALAEQKEILLGAGMLKEHAEMLDRTMERVDALRRNKVYVKVREALDILTDQAGLEDTALSEAIGDSIRQVEDAILETGNDMLDVGETAMTELETELQKRLIELVMSDQGKTQKPEEYLKILKSLAALNDIMNGVHTDPEEEKRLLEEELIPRAKAAGEKAFNELQFYEEMLKGFEKAEEDTQTELEKLYTEKEDLKQKRLEALDKNDLKEAKKLEDLLEDKNRVIKERETSIAGGQEEPEGNLSVEDAAEVLAEEAEGSTQTELVALSMYCEQIGTKELGGLLKGKAELAAGETDAFIFPKVTGTGGEHYVSAEALASYSSYRYIFSSNKKEATLASKGDFYKFQAFDNIVEREGGKQTTLAYPCRFRATVYIPGDYAEKEFAVLVCELYGTGYCVLTDENLQKKAARVCEALIEKGGE